MKRGRCGSARVRQSISKPRRAYHSALASASAHRNGGNSGHEHDRTATNQLRRRGSRRRRAPQPAPRARSSACRPASVSRPPGCVLPAPPAPRRHGEPSRRPRARTRRGCASEEPPLPDPPGGREGAREHALEGSPGTGAAAPRPGRSRRPVPPARELEHRRALIEARTSPGRAWSGSPSRRRRPASAPAATRRSRRPGTRSSCHPGRSRAPANRPSPSHQSSYPAPALVAASMLLEYGRCWRPAELLRGPGRRGGLGLRSLCRPPAPTRHALDADHYRSVFTRRRGSDEPWRPSLFGVASPASGRPRPAAARTRGSAPRRPDVLGHERDDRAKKIAGSAGRSATAGLPVFLYGELGMRGPALSGGRPRAATADAWRLADFGAVRLDVAGVVVVGAVAADRVHASSAARSSGEGVQHVLSRR